MERLSNKAYKNEFVHNFKGDESGDLQPRQTPGVLYSRAAPTAVSNPRLLAWSEELAAELGIEKPNKEDVEILAGNRLAPSMQSYAACYGGHQFGHWAGQLGDGRAITLGEWQTEEGKSWELQLKGAGLTPYSRRADGRAVLRSSVREYMMSEAMHYLGVPTTRALSLVSTGDKVLRDMFYNGNPEFEPGAIVMRVAPSFIRFGNFEILAARKEYEHLRQLVDWTISRYYPHITGEDKLILWYREVIERTASMIVEWLRVGFVHGVMNTDNMSILGLTIDYGPYSFLDDYDPQFTPNTTDLPGRRYAFGQQAGIAYWNLGCLANAIAPIFESTDGLIAALKEYEKLISEKFFAMMAGKLGLDRVAQEDAALITQWEQTLILLKPDMTIFYQLLIDLPLELEGEEQVVNHFSESFYEDPDQPQRQALYSLMQKWVERVRANTSSREESRARMKKSNPRFILRNYLLHQAIEGLEEGDSSLFNKLEAAMKEPYSGKGDEFFAKRPEWATQKAGCSQLSCSS
ncbi:YdiU family protein [Cesiribacter sp. SM1]|uniref:protein adenylyltransferase SelO n=1 Tax=Cesiribacter sp. SM1 TaxID=2861196 RepID=UPI001CD72E37|nr:YdiU family protein [Cesiribacter sp. SM1]